MSILVAEKSLKARFPYQSVADNGDYIYNLEVNDEAYGLAIIAGLGEEYAEVDLCGFQCDYNKTEEGIFWVVTVDRDAYQEVVDQFKSLKKSCK